MSVPIRVFVVDDTLTARQLLTHIVNQSGDMVVVGEANDGEQALRRIAELKPDVVLMDIVMPRMDGLEATRRIMKTYPIPIVLVTASYEPSETDIAFQAMRAGALTLLYKPSALEPQSVSYLRSTLRSMAQVKVIHHYSDNSERATQLRRVALQVNTPTSIDLIAIASSTGGPAALAEIVKPLPRDFPVPIAIVQHISPDFVASMVSWLQTVTELTVEEAQVGVVPQKGHIYLAPGNAHLRVDFRRSFQLDATAGTWRYMPSCDAFLYSVAQNYGKSAVGVVLTGMGDDGADGLAELYKTGAVTLAQDEATSVVYGMPREAVLRGGVQEVLPVTDIAPFLINLVKSGDKDRG